MSANRVFVTRQIPDEGLEILNDYGADVTVFQTEEDAGVTHEELLQGVREGCDVLLSLLTEPVDREVLAANEGLLGVAQMAVGYNNIDVEAATEFGIPVTNTPGILTETTADCTWALLLASARRVVAAHNYMTEGWYNLWGPNLFLGEDVGPGGADRSKVLGIIGYGRIGEAVAKRAMGFDMTVLAFDPYGKDRVLQSKYATWAEFDEILERGDFVTLHVALTDETRHLIGAPELERMKPTAHLINAARGPVIDEKALVTALEEGWIAGAGLDVYEDEPEMAEGLAECTNAVLLPHIASASSDTRGLMATMAANNAIAHLRVERAPNVVNPEVYETEAYQRRTKNRVVVEPAPTPAPVSEEAVASGWDARLRRDASAILEAGVAAVEPQRLVREYLEVIDLGLTEEGKFEVVAVGKACAAMARGAAEVLEDEITSGLVLGPPGTGSGAPEGFTVFEGGHPLPDEAGLEGAEAIHHVARGLVEGDCLLLLLSGGSSALLTLPPEAVGLDEVCTVTETLMQAGASIEELNTVRKHLDQIKGGRLAEATAPARVVAMVLSDVVGDPLHVIGSGPVSPDPTTFADAVAVLERYGGIESAPFGVRAYLQAGIDGRAPESQKPEDPCFGFVESVVIGNNQVAAEAARAAAESLGYAAELLTTAQTGEARVVGGEFAALGRAIQAGEHDVRAPACIVVAGETTVTVKGSGRGGRNQELVLAAAVELDGTERILIASMGTDGIDGPTPAAGAVSDGRTAARAKALGIDLVASLAENDAYHVFAPLDDLIVTGPTGTNVMDLMLVLVAPD